MLFDELELLLLSERRYGREKALEMKTLDGCLTAYVWLDEDNVLTWEFPDAGFNLYYIEESE